MGRTTVIVLDTHVLIWWVSDPKKLSKKAAEAIRKAAAKKEILISSISVWEISLLVQKGRLQLTMDINKWIEKVERLPSVRFVPIDTTIAQRSVFLPGVLHQDPADRMIIATARQRGATLLTSDQKIRSYRHVRTMW